MQVTIWGSRMLHIGEIPTRTVDVETLEQIHEAIQQALRAPEFAHEMSLHASWTGPGRWGDQTLHECYYYGPSHWSEMNEPGTQGWYVQRPGDIAGVQLYFKRHPSKGPALLRVLLDHEGTWTDGMAALGRAVEKKDAYELLNSLIRLGLVEQLWTPEGARRHYQLTELGTAVARGL